MGIRTGRQYLDKLNGMTPEIYVNGEKITSDIADHPLFRNSARTYAHLFEQVQRETAEKMDAVLTIPESEKVTPIAVKTAVKPALRRVK